MDKKTVTLLDSINGKLYEILPKTSFSQVVNKDDYTLTEVINELKTLIDEKASDENLKEIIDILTAINENAPEEFNSFKKIYDYINLNSDTSNLSIALNEKVDVTDFENEISSIKTEITESIASNVTISEDESAPEDMKNGAFWFQVIK